MRYTCSIAAFTDSVLDTRRIIRNRAPFRIALNIPQGSLSLQVSANEPTPDASSQFNDSISGSVGRAG